MIRIRVIDATVVAGGRVFTEPQLRTTPDEIEPDKDSSAAQAKN